jgi:hypothetical protein
MKAMNAGSIHESISLKISNQQQCFCYFSVFSACGPAAMPQW